MTSSKPAPGLCCSSVMTIMHMLNILECMEHFGHTQFLDTDMCT